MTEKSEFICILHDHSACPYCAEDFQALQTRLTELETELEHSEAEKCAHEIFELQTKLTEAEGKLLVTDAKLEATRGFSSDLEKKLAEVTNWARSVERGAEATVKRCKALEAELATANRKLLTLKKIATKEPWTEEEIAIATERADYKAQLIRKNQELVEKDERINSLKCWQDEAMYFLENLKIHGENVNDRDDLLLNGAEFAGLHKLIKETYETTPPDAGSVTDEGTEGKS